VNERTNGRWMGGGEVGEDGGGSFLHLFLLTLPPSLLPTIAMVRPPSNGEKICGIRYSLQ